MNGLLMNPATLPTLNRNDPVIRELAPPDNHPALTRTRIHDPDFIIGFEILIWDQDFTLWGCYLPVDRGCGEELNWDSVNPAIMNFVLADFLKSL